MRFPKQYSLRFLFGAVFVIAAGLALFIAHVKRVEREYLTAERMCRSMGPSFKMQIDGKLGMMQGTTLKPGRNGEFVFAGSDPTHAVSSIAFRFDVLPTNALDKMLLKHPKISVTKVTAGGPLIDDQTLSTISEFSSIKTLELRPSRISSNAYKLLENLPLLQDLVIDLLPLDARQPTPDATELAQVIAKLTELEGLKISCVPLLEMDLAKFASLRRLMSLRVESADLTGEGFAAFSNHTALQTVIITSIRFTDEGLRRLSEIPSLRTLVLNGDAPDVSADGLKTLLDRPNLKVQFGKAIRGSSTFVAD